MSAPKIDVTTLAYRGLGNSCIWHEPRGFHDTWRFVHDSGRIVARVRRMHDGEYETGGEFYATLEAAKAAVERGHA
jgi:hypothetical protein